jgi:hypothetical protein
MEISAGVHDECLYVPLSEYSWNYLLLFYEGRGRCYGVTLPFNPAIWCLVAAFHAITVWMAIGLNLQLLLTFKKRTTLYFW